MFRVPDGTATARPEESGVTAVSTAVCPPVHSPVSAVQFVCPSASCPLGGQDSFFTAVSPQLVQGMDEREQRRWTRRGERGTLLPDSLSLGTEGQNLRKGLASYTAVPVHLLTYLLFILKLS